jgi:hypothetical protein
VPQVLAKFVENFEMGGVVDGKVTKDEWRQYYSGLSASIDDDSYFELMIRNAWHVSGQYWSSPLNTQAGIWRLVGHL